MDELFELVEPDPVSPPSGRAALSNGQNPENGVEVKETGQAPRLANEKAPYYNYQNQRERYTHRIMLECAAKGMSVKEIAEYTGRTPVCVNNVLRQPFLQQTLVNEIQRLHGNVDDEVVEVIKSNVLASTRLYEKVLNDEKQDLDRRLSVADRFMNRRYGKPAQPMAQGSVVDLNSLSDEELAKLIPTHGTGTSK